MWLSAPRGLQECSPNRASTDVALLMMQADSVLDPACPEPTRDAVT